MSYKPREAFCIECKKLFMKKHPCSTRCPECQKTYNKMRQKRAYDIQARQKEAKKKRDPHICTKAKSCKYGGTLSDVPCCDYMIKVGHRRPCPAKGCTEYKRKGRKCEKSIHNPLMLLALMTCARLWIGFNGGQA